MTYPELLVVFVAAAAVVWAFARWSLRGRATTGSLSAAAPPSGRAIIVAFVVLTVLTVVFDNLMIAAGLVEYGEDKLAGIYLWRAPVEDLSYPLAGVLLLPALWHLLAARGERRR